MSFVYFSYKFIWICYVYKNYDKIQKKVYVIFVWDDPFEIVYLNVRKFVHFTL